MKKPIQFNYDKYLRGNVEIATRCGNEVKHLNLMPDVDDEFCLVGVVNGSILTWTYDGHLLNDGNQHEDDLAIMVEDTDMYAITFQYRLDAGEHGIRLFKNKKEAEAALPRMRDMHNNVQLRRLELIC